MQPTQAQPHCPGHAHFQQDCAVCKRAVANSQPYPLRKDLAVPTTRSFGYKDDLSEAKLRGPSWSSGNTAFDVPEEVTLSLAALRFILRLIWPFSKII